MVSPSVRRFDLRLRILAVVHRAITGFDLSDALLVLSLGFIFIGLAAPSAAFGVVGFLLLPLTDIWTNVLELLGRKPRGR